MNETVKLITDTASVALFDPQRLAIARPWNVDWAGTPSHHIPHVASGDLALFSLGGDGFYTVRITDGPLTPDERAYAAVAVQGFGVVSDSDTLAVGPLESLPDADDCPRISVPRGAYLVDAYLIDSRDSPRWWRDEGEPAAQDSPPDVVLVLRPRPTDVPFVAPDEEPRLVEQRNQWLFPDEPREIGPRVGMLLTTTVRKSPTSLTLKPCGPGNYAATLTDFSPVRWKDRIRLRVLSVDHAKRSLVGEWVQTLPPEP